MVVLYLRRSASYSTLPMAIAKKLCLIIRPTAEHGSDSRRRSDLLLRYLVTPALEECGYLPVRADKISEPGVITSQIIEHIVDEPLVVADLSGLKAEVFYALALRHAARKPLVQIAKVGEKLPFDTPGMNVVAVDHTDLESVDKAKVEIIKQIKATEGKRPEEIDSPVSVAMQLKLMRLNGETGERSLVEVLSFMNDLRNDLCSQLAAIERRISDTHSITASPDLTDHHLLKVSRLGARDEMNAFLTEIGRIEDLLAPSKQSMNGESTHREARLKEASARLMAIRQRGEILRASPQC